MVHFHPMSSNQVLQITDLTKVYGTGKKAKSAVSGITFAVEKGSFYGLLGPNGAGKSTTIGCVVGTHNLTSGSILVNGYDVVSQYKEARRMIGFSAQDYNINPFETVYNLLDFMGGYYGLPKKERRDRLDALLKKFALEEHAQKQFKELSGGLKRRVVLARALIHEPELLILDEPTAGVDVEQRHQIWHYLQELNQSGTTIILTSHYLEEVELLCDRVAIINEGRIIADQEKTAYLKNGRSLEAEYLSITQGETY